MKDLLAAWLLFSGAAFILVAAIGLLRLPDVLCRSHAVGKAATLGIFSILLGLWLAMGSEAAGFKVLLAILFQVVTIPVASHLVGMLALRKNLPRWKETGDRGSGPDSQ